MRAQRSCLASLVRTTLAIGVTCGWLIAGAATVSAQINIEIVSPAPDSPQDEQMVVIAAVSSSSPLTSVQAAVGARTVALSPSLGHHWSGTISLAGLPRAPHEVIVTATNAATEKQQATRVFLFDKAPVLAVTSPANDTLGQPDVRVTASCTDDGPTCRISVRDFGSGPIAAGEGSIDALIRPPDGARLIEFIATDSAGRITQASRQIYVNSNQKLTPLTIYPNRIFDLQADRALVYDERNAPFTLRIVDRATNASQTIWTANASEAWVHSGYLTPGGALFTVRHPLNNEVYLREWRSGTVLDLGQTASTILAVKGQWAVYNAYNMGLKPLIRRNLITGTNTEIDPDAGDIYNDVTADGRVIFWDYTGPPAASPSQIYEYTPGSPATRTPLTAHPTDSSSYPVTDGVSVVFARSLNFTQPASIVLCAVNGTETILATFADTRQPLPDLNYRIAAGWVAFTRPGSGGSIQAWLRAPDGTERQLSSTAGTATIMALSETGEVIFNTFQPAQFSHLASRRFLARADGMIVDLGEPSGVVHLIDGAWYVSNAGHVFAVQPETATRSILSEGATGTFFTTDVAILNPNDDAVPVTIRYLRENAPELQETRTLPARSRTTIREDHISGLENTSVSTVVETPGTTPVVVERLMSWDATGYGGHLGASVERPRPRWLFAEGAQGFFHTFFLLANSGATTATVKLTFLVELGTPVTHTVEVRPGARKTFFAGDRAELVNRSFATVIESDVPIVAERAMYFGGEPLWLGGHGSAGVPEPAHTWFHAEGATGSPFDTFILLANPHPVEVTVDVNYSTDRGQTIRRPRTLPPFSRLTINIEDEAPELANAAVSTRVDSYPYPIVSERAMYWSTTASGWREAHNSFGVTSSDVKWGLAEGRSGGPRGYQTYVLVYNTAVNTRLELRATFIKEDGTTVVREYTVAAQTRFNIDTAGITQLANSNFSTILESTNGTAFNAESAIYWSVDGVIWEGGGNTVATRLP